MSLQNIQNLVTDLCRDNTQSVLLKQYEKNSRFIIVKCTENGAFKKLDNKTMTCNIKVLTPDDRAIYNSCEILNDGTVKVAVSESMVYAAGVAKAELNIIDSSSTTLLATMIFNLIIKPSAYSDVKIIASDEFSALTKLITIVEGTTKTVIELEAKISAEQSEWKKNENTRQSNELDRIKNENTRTSNEDTRISNENDRKSAENTRNTNENTRISNEQTRQSQESARQENEYTRIDAENNRNSAENIRETNENTRITNENDRKTSESDRVNAELLRENAEKERINAENQRKDNETTRKQNESDRQEAESLRESNTSTAISNAEKATFTANEATENANAAIAHVTIATENANNATTNANNVASQLLEDKANGLFKGDKGDKGDTGESGITAPVSGFFTLSVDADGNLWSYSESGTTPNFEYDSETGSLYIVQEVS